jgi:hypothetical protein
MFICFLSLFVSVQVSDAYVNVLSVIVFFSLSFSFRENKIYKWFKPSGLDDLKDCGTHIFRSQWFKKNSSWTSYFCSVMVLWRTANCTPNQPHHHVLAWILNLQYVHHKPVFCCILIQQFYLTINWFCSCFVFSSASRTSHTGVPHLSVEEWSYQHVWLDH